MNQKNQWTSPSSPSPTLERSPSAVRPEEPPPPPPTTTTQQYPQHENTIDISSQVNWYFQLKDHKVWEEFQHFYRTQHLSYCFKFLLFAIHCLFVLTIYQLIKLTCLQSVNEKRELVHIVYEVIININFFLLSIVGWKIFAGHSVTVSIIPLYFQAWMLKLQSKFSPFSTNMNTSALTFQEELSTSIQRVEMSIQSLRDTSTSTSTTRLSPKSSRVAPLPKFYVNTSSLLDPVESLDNKASSGLSNSAATSDRHLKAMFVILIQCLLITSVFLNMHLAFWKSSNTWMLGMPHIVSEFPSFFVIFTSFGCFSIPYFIFTTFQDISIAVVWIIYVVTFICEIGILNSLQTLQTLPAVLVITFWFLCITIDSQYQKIYIFFCT